MTKKLQTLLLLLCGMTTGVLVGDTTNTALLVVGGLWIIFVTVGIAVYLIQKHRE